MATDLTTSQEEIDKTVMWDILCHKSIKDQLIESQNSGNLTDQLAATFVKIANDALSKAQFRVWPNRDEVVNEAVLMMLKNWPRIDPNCNIYSYLITLTTHAAHQYQQRELSYRMVKDNLLEFLAVSQIS